MAFYARWNNIGIHEKRCCDNKMIFLIESRIMLSAIATFRIVGLQPSLGNLASYKKPASPDGFAG